MNRSVRGVLPAHTHTHTHTHTHAQTHKVKSTESAGGFVQGLVWGLGMCAAVAVLSLLACALIAYRSSDPDALFIPLGFGALALSCLAGGLGVGLRCNHAVLPCALLCGCIFVGMGLVLGLFFGTDARQNLTLGLGLGASLGIRAGAVILFCAAAVLTTQVKGKLQAMPRHR